MYFVILTASIKTYALLVQGHRLLLLYHYHNIFLQHYTEQTDCVLFFKKECGLENKTTTIYHLISYNYIHLTQVNKGNVQKLHINFKIDKETSRFKIKNFIIRRLNIFNV